MTIAVSKEFKKVFGGYTDISWRKPGNFGVSKTGSGKSFIFSVSDSGQQIEKLEHKGY